MPLTNPITLLQVALNPFLLGEITLNAGSGISLTQVGQNITITATGGGSGTVTQVNTGTGLTGGPITTTGIISVVANTTNQQVQVDKNGSSVGTRKEINLIEGSNITLTVVDNSGSDRLDVTIASSGGGGGSNAGAYRCSAYNTGVVSIPDNTETSVTFDTNLYDTDTMHSTSVNTNRITFNHSGPYHISASLEFNFNGGEGYAYIILNNTTTLDLIALTPTSTEGVASFVMSLDYTFSSSDYIEFRVRHKGIGGSQTTNNRSTRFSAYNIA